MHETAQVVLRHATILIGDANETIHHDGALVIEDGHIAYIGPDADLPPLYASFDQLDCSDALVLPSLINCHTHTGMVAFRSLGDDIPDRLRRFLLPLERSCMTADLAQTSAALAIAEMQLAGIGCAVDMYYYEQEIAKIASAMHFSLFAGETVMEESPCNSSHVEQAIAYASSIQNTPCTRRIYAAHAPYSVSVEHLRKLKQLAEEQGLRWTMHLSEMDFEWDYYTSTFQQTPIEYLDSQGLLDARLLAAHCVRTTDNDLDLLAKHKVTVVHCPGANAKSGKGVARVHEMLQRGIRVCLGTDGPASGNTLDLFTQMKLCAILQKNAEADRTVLPARSVVPMATRSAAEALGIGHSTGSLEAGKDADILVLGLEQPNMQPCFDPYSVVVYSAGPHNVRHLFSKGVHVVCNHTLTLCDLQELKVNFAQAARPFFSQAQKLISG
ncbi:amidohydrolase family protein [Sphaerochaeta sp.]|uniref:amidohydrolase family protein n=1 Tax=Sphaerochaeta sp. TaxID=1972642 RepID=UPI002FCB58AD